MVLIDRPTAALAIAPRLTSAPRPSQAQLAWQREELAMFVHLGMNTFTDREWGEGTEDPALFDPAALDARQWARTARGCGFGTLVLTAKHHDGFCLWPSATTNHTVAASPWRGGSGDVVREAADACAAEGIRFGVYCSPWDRNAASYGSGRAYDDLYLAQLTELLTGYGDIAEVWFDGAVGETARGRQAYDWDRIWGTVRELQPEAVIFSDAGPDARWVGNEDGVAGSTSWSSVDPARVPAPGRSDPWTTDSLCHGDPDGTVWRPAETDVSIRPGWFWHEAENERVLDGGALLDLYLTSVGRNSKLLLNVPPDRRGLLGEDDVAALRSFATLREEVLGTDLLAGATLQLEEGALVITPPGPVTANLLTIAEDIEHGQHVASFRIQVDDGEGAGWRPLASGTTIGHLRALTIPPTRVHRLRLLLDLAYGRARLTHVTHVSLHHDTRGEHRRRADNHD